MGGDLVVARTESPGVNVRLGEACGNDIDGPLAILASRGSNRVSAVAIRPDGTLSCDAPAAACGIDASGTGFGDPLPVAVACGNGKARAYFGYRSAQSNQGWIGELELASGATDRFAIRTANVGSGAIIGLAYDGDRDRLLIAGIPEGTPIPLRWVDLAGCTLGVPLGQGGCTVGSAPLPLVNGSLAIELHAIALARHTAPGRRASDEPIRAYLTGTLYDAGSAASSSYRNTTLGGVLVVADLFDDASGGVRPVIVSTVALPSGPQGIEVLPRLPSWPSTRRDVVAVVSVDVGSLTVYDDETAAIDTFGIDASGPSATGAPILGHQAYGLAVDPTIVGSTARIWVGSFKDSFVTPIDVTLDPALAATFAGGRQLKLPGATP
jgi:hypothetical protein